MQVGTETYRSETGTFVVKFRKKCVTAICEEVAAIMQI
jgi:hypothetical protein